MDRMLNPGDLTQYGTENQPIVKLAQIDSAARRGSARPSSTTAGCTYPRRRQDKQA